MLYLSLPLHYKDTHRTTAKRQEQHVHVKNAGGEGEKQGLGVWVANPLALVDKSLVCSSVHLNIFPMGTETA